MVRADQLHDLRFLVERSSGGEERRREASSLIDVAIGLGVNVLDVDTFVTNPHLSETPRRRGFSTRALHFESLTIEQRAVLLVLTPPGVKTRVNDRPSPIVAVLDVGDQLRVGETVLHVTRYREFAVGPPTSELLGRRCEVCRVPFDHSTQVYVHDCGTPMHLESKSKPADERLECALLGACPNCEEPVVMQSGYSYLPEL
jgi:hypothetical protein